MDKDTTNFELDFAAIGLNGEGEYRVHDLWTGEEKTAKGKFVVARVAGKGAEAFRFYPTWSLQDL